MGSETNEEIIEINLKKKREIIINNIKI